MWQQLLKQLQQGDIKALARAISFVENEQQGYEEMLGALPSNNTAKIIGVTGPPGAGKSTLVDGLIGEVVRNEKKVAVLCVDPSSPFNLGAVLGDRIRMSEWYLHPQVFIRSLATRGAIGGLHAKMIELTELVKCAGFDFVIIETVGVGQSEVEISGLADVTIVVLVPEAGDEVQTMKAGLMEIADIFVVNKADRPGAETFVKNLRQMLAPAFHKPENEIAIIKTVAHEQQGLKELFEAINTSLLQLHPSDKKYWLLAERAWQLIEKKKMTGLDKKMLLKNITTAAQKPGFNLYQFALAHL